MPGVPRQPTTTIKEEKTAKQRCIESMLRYNNYIQITI